MLLVTLCRLCFDTTRQTLWSDVSAGHLRAVALSDLGREGQDVRLVACISLEQILPRPQAGLLSRMLRLADVPLVRGTPYNTVLMSVTWPRVDSVLHAEIS